MKPEGPKAVLQDLTHQYSIDVLDVVQRDALIEYSKIVDSRRSRAAAALLFVVPHAILNKYF